MRRRNWLIIGGVVTVIVVVTAVIVLTGGPERGEPTPDAAVTTYLGALAANDVDRLTEIADDDTDTTAQAEDHLRRYGDGRLKISGTSVNDTEADHMKSATVTGTLDGAPYSGKIWLERHDGRWYVRLRTSLTAA